MWALFTLQDSVADQLTTASGADTADVHLTGWYAAACVAAVGCVLTTLLAVRLVPGWPEMGRRYDAPAGEARAGRAAGQPGDLEGPRRGA